MRMLISLVTRKRILLIPALFLIQLLACCTENPIQTDESISTNPIRGTVELSDGLSPNGVYVWFQALDIGTRTDENGRFELNLPPPGAQAAGGLDGLFNLYFYMANYRLDSVQVAILDGRVRYSRYGINSKGELAERIVLGKIIRITTAFDPDSLFVSTEDTITAQFTVAAHHGVVNVSVTVSNSPIPNDRFVVGLVRKKGSGQGFCRKIYRQGRTHRTVDFQVGISPTQLLPLEIGSQPGLMPTGEYEAMPDIVIHQKLPIGLLESLRQYGDVCHDFFAVPLLVEVNGFRVVAER